MTAAKRKKNSRLRGSHTHGYGSKKKHRGAGSRGGRGMAGTGKRGDVKKPSIWKNKKYFGKHGFKKKNIKDDIQSINIRTLIQEIPKLTEKKIAIENNGVYEIDLEKIGYNKLLSTGKPTLKLKIKVLFASAKAIEKITSAGGEITGLKIAEKKEPAKKNKEE